MTKGDLMASKIVLPRRGKPSDMIHAGLKKRRAAEFRFKLYGVIAVSLGLLFLAFLFATIFGNAYTAFMQTQIKLELVLDAQVLDPEGKRDADTLSSADYGTIVKAAMGKLFPEVVERRDQRALNDLVSQGATYLLRDMVLQNPDLIGKTISLWVPAADDVDMLQKGEIKRSAPEDARRVKDNQLVWLDRLQKEGRLEKQFNVGFFTNGDSREPEIAGIWGGLVGTFITLSIPTIASVRSISRRSIFSDWKTQILTTFISNNWSMKKIVTYWNDCSRGQNGSATRPNKLFCSERILTAVRKPQRVCLWP